MNDKSVTLADFLSANQIAEALAIWRKNMTPAKEIAERVISPNISQINARLGQDNDPLYLAYACENVFNQTMKRVP